MSLDPRFHPTPPEPEWTVCEFDDVFINEDGRDVPTTIRFEYSVDFDATVTIMLIDGYQFDIEQAQEMVLNYMKITKAEFNHL
jgi:hypothetical protein